MNLLTVVVTAYLAIVILRSFLRGFSKTLFSMLFLVLVIGTTAVLAPQMTKLFQGSENLQEFFQAKSAQFIESGGSASVSVGRDASAGDVASAAVNLALGVAGVGSIEAGGLTDYLMNVSATVTTFVLACIFWLIVEIVLARMRKDKAVRTIDHVLGIPLGAVRGILSVWVVLGLISLLSFTGPGRSLAAQVAESPFLLYLYENNLLAKGIRTLVIGGL